jgi:hypothetical protein
MPMQVKSRTPRSRTKRQLIRERQVRRAKAQTSCTEAWMGSTKHWTISERRCKVHQSNNSRRTSSRAHSRTMSKCLRRQLSSQWCLISSRFSNQFLLPCRKKR